MTEIRKEGTPGAVLIVGAGPAGLTAALELIEAGIQPIIVEQSDVVGGISRTVNHLGNRMDIGGHRFFSKSEWVTQWWERAMRLPAPKATAADWLTRSRLSRIYYLRQFFDYPLKLNVATLRKLGAFRLAGIGYGYLMANLFPRHPEKSLEDFLVNRFGDRLYRTFFKDYTEKVWGVPCHEISAAWGAQRIKGLSITKAVGHALKSALKLEQKKVNTSLIEAFSYPRLGPGQLWEQVAAYVEAKGGKILFNTTLSELKLEHGRVVCAGLMTATGMTRVAVESVFSSMPVKNLVEAIQMTHGGAQVPADVYSIAHQLPYRDFVTIGVLVNKKLDLPDNWIYVQEPDVKLGRIQVFNNWSPDLVAKEGTTWLGLEYFCQEDDPFWQMSDFDLRQLAVSELVRLGLVAESDVDRNSCCVIRVPKAYPAYFGTYAQFDKVREYLDTIDGLYLMGRNGQHRYNNQDHSMLTAKRAVEAFLGQGPKSAVWDVNIDDDYHEVADEKK